MTEAFACPECGAEVTLLGATPGREVACALCGTLVEVPYLPRGGVWTRSRFRKARPSWVIPLAWAGVGLLAVVLAILAGWGTIASRGRAARVATLDEFLRAADDAESARQPGRALAEVEAALAYLRSEGTDLVRPEGLDEIRRRRDGLSVREAEARVAAAAGRPPDDAAGDLLSLQARARSDRALDPLAPTIREALDGARRRQVADGLAGALRARDDSRPFDTLALAERALVVADKLDADAFRAATAEAEGLASPIVGRIGVIVDQAPGQYTLGSAEAYDIGLGARLADALRRIGYAPRPPSGHLRPLWDRLAPARLSFRVGESQEALYLQSPSRLSEIVASLALTRGPSTPWQDRVTARTRVPLPDLPAYIGGRLAVSDHRNPETERRLYEDARVQVFDMVTLKARGIPGP